MTQKQKVRTGPVNKRLSASLECVRIAFRYFLIS